jgi:3-deoxy-D-manno-octulosonic-acid transferase
MTVIYNILYMIAFALALPLLWYKSWRTGKYRGTWPERFGKQKREPSPKPAGQKRLMLHCVSVGELLSVKQLVEKLLEDPNLLVIITTTTDTGTARAKEIYGAEKYKGRVETYRYPLDFSWSVKRVLNHARPDAVALIELETWPNFIRIAVKRKIPVVIINGRLTARALSRYRWVKPVVNGMMKRLVWLGIQTETIAARFAELGAARDKIEIIPTLKYDTADLSPTIAGADTLAKACGISASHKLFVAGSTGPGEEEILIATYQAIQKNHPAARFAIAPRKPETVPQVIEAVKKSGLKPVMRTDRIDGTESAPLAADEVLILNTMGELKKLYSLSFANFVGRSLVPLGGSDMIEVSAMGKPCCFGPHTANFAEAVELLVSANAAIAMKDEQYVLATIQNWYDKPEEAAAMGRRAQAVIAAQRGSTEKYVAKLRSLLPR